MKWVGSKYYNVLGNITYEILFILSFRAIFNNKLINGLTRVIHCKEFIAIYVPITIHHTISFSHPQSSKALIIGEHKYSGCPFILMMILIFH